ncbi:hypothetical protein RI103_21580 [Paraburkholderia sp. FT54]|uniref:hypothetical protein n=1 Tax=Paraburkholderia sp. FT54 TaxID=3074437 RepID=UPI002877AFBA|nr:hypothetical protein [Paraburkholderia sp. FT54]WNC93399.1 hypothetical protein RI103_21580 [Paraburkholderia sp. FT54]
MSDVLEWLIDISVASASAAATGSIFLLLVGVAGETRRHVVKHRAVARMPKAKRPGEPVRLDRAKILTFPFQPVNISFHCKNIDRNSQP